MRIPDLEPWRLELVAGLVGCSLGPLAHHGLFIRGEWHVRTPEILVFHALILGAVLLGPIGLNDARLAKLCEAGSVAGICYVVTLLSSIVAYRVWFHALTKAGFPGPLYLRASKICHVWECRFHTNHVFLDDLNKKYGDFVRTGPSEITVYRPEVFAATDGPRTTCVKSDWYDLLWPESSLLTTRDRTLHDARRRDWKTGFSPKALAYHSAKVLKHGDLLDKAIEADIQADRPSNMRNYFYWLGFDFMGDFVMSRSCKYYIYFKLSLDISIPRRRSTLHTAGLVLITSSIFANFLPLVDMLTQQDWHHMVVRLQRALSLLGLVNPAPWLIQIAFRVGPRILEVGDWFKMTAWTHEQVGKRLEAGLRKDQDPDLVSYLLEQEDSEPRTAESILRMRGDSLNAIVAGSEPIPAVLVGLFSELAQQPHYVELLHSEVAEVDAGDTKILGRLPLLNAVVNEGLRLYPVLPTGGSRQTTSEGVVVDGVFIPPYTKIVSPRFSIQRREDCFERANDFVPERWTTRKDMIRNIAAFSPWGEGHHSCIARAMAHDMLRITTAQLVKKYRFRLASGEVPGRALIDMKDQLAPQPGSLSLCFEPR